MAGHVEGSLALQLAGPEASIPAGHKNNSTALAADWTDETWSRPPHHDSTQCADPEAHWGHRNWRGRPLTSHEVIVQTIAATTATGLRVHAELDTTSYDTGAQISDRQMQALPLDRHGWHGVWNYTLHPREYDQIPSTPDPSGQPSPGLAWLAHPAVAGLPAPDWDTLIATLLTLHDQQRETALDKRRGHRPRLTAPGTGRRPLLTLADRLLATMLHYRLHLPQVAIAALFSVRPETINKRIRDVRQLLDQAGHTIQPSPHRLANLDDLYGLAGAEDLGIPSEIKTAR